VSDPATDRLLDLARGVLGAPDLTADDVLADRGGTSLSLARILAVAGLRLGMEIDLRDLPGAVTVRALAAAAAVAP
jgi:regulator of sirC expression with transglutaminase-like and TPR domain